MYPLHPPASTPPYAGRQQPPPPPDGQDALLGALQQHEADWTLSWLVSNADPELWAPRQFIIVDELTKGSPALAATWRAIYRLWLFYRPTGRRRFGLRMIADVGGVGRGHLGGTHGAIRKLHDLGLITVRNLNTNPRDDAGRSESWEYEINPLDLEAKSVRLIRDRLTSGQIVAQRRPPQTHQQDLFAALDLAPAEAILDLSGAAADSATATPFVAIPAVAPSGTSTQPALAPTGATHAPTAPPATYAAPNGAGTMPAMAPDGVTPGACSIPAGVAATPQRHPTVPESPAAAPIGASFTPATAPDQDMWHRWVPHARTRRVPDQPDPAPAGAHGWMDGEIERERERTAPSLAPDISLQTIEQMIERTLARYIPQLTQQMPSLIPEDDTIPRDIPTAPPDEPALPLPLLAIWEGVTSARPSPNDLTNLRMLIARYQAPTQGYAPYWIGRVMLFADMCRTNDEPIRLKLVNSYMHRMVDAGFSTMALEDRTQKGEKGARRPDRAALRPAPATPEPSELPSGTHPAIAAYVAAFGRTPNAVQAQQIAQAITDLTVWQRVLTDWQANGWKEGGVAKMLDRYQKETGEAAANEPPPSSFAIHERSDLPDDVRDRWVRRFHAAASPAEKRAVLARLAQEHPR